MSSLSNGLSGDLSRSLAGDPLGDFSSDPSGDVRLPIHDVIGEIRQTLRDRLSCILEAPPGAGKTTIVPLSLLDEDWCAGKKIVVLEPRRLAAKAAARRMASLLGEKAGATVGYRMRMESAIGPTTRIEVVTEGVLTRQLARDPALAGIGIVIFDEFHERSLHADTGLALTLMSRAILRPDLRVMIMSATLSSMDLTSILPDAGIVTSHGRSFPVDVQWMRSTSDKQIHELMDAAIRDAVHDNTGDVLCFLPGQGEIRRTLELLKKNEHSLHGAAIHVLHGELSGQDQDNILRPSTSTPRIILSTAIAETSITIDGVRTVIDGGRSREPRFDPRSGMSHLTTVSVSKDSAEQRRGRAGRTAPGKCVRLWTEQEHQHLPDRKTPEIMVADCAPMLLEIAAFGTHIDDLSWLDVPPPAHLLQARELLRELDALNEDDSITVHGRNLLHYGVHPRVAHMLVRASGLNIDHDIAASVAALIGERDILRGSRDADIQRRIEACNGAYDAEADRGAVENAKKRREQFLRVQRKSTVRTQQYADAVGILIALAYPDRIARRKSDGRYLMRNGRTARLHPGDMLSQHEWLAVSDLDGSGTEPRIAMAAVIHQESVLATFSEFIVQKAEAGWNDRDGKIVARTVRMIGAIVLDTQQNANIDADEIACAFARVIAERGFRDLPWSDSATRLRNRVVFAHHFDATNLPQWTDESLAQGVEQWLAPSLRGKRTLGDLQKLDLAVILRENLTYEQLRRVDTVAPEFYHPPKGREVPIDYSNVDRPTIAVRLQFMFGVKRTPTVALGNVPLTIELLSPADRPLQVTQDLAGFWQGSYAHVRKEMKGRYPKHNWPEHP
ncbi:MAG: ATP-dependent helicase HrpB [Candidatus Kapabacteria bacterium]|nr:ATP-dependent helicase HrpB [Candidatus Kapabacteria bacterium]